MGVVVLLALGLCDLDVLRLGAQPTAASRPRTAGDGAVLEVAVVGCRGFGDRGIGFPVGVAVVVDAGQHHFASHTHVLPAARAALAHRDVPHRVAGSDVDIEVHHTHIGHRVIGILGKIRCGLGGAGSVYGAAVVNGQRFGLQQWARVGELVSFPLVGVVAREPVLEASAATEQVEAVLLVLGDGGLHQFLAFCPDVAEASARQELDGSGQVFLDAGLGVLDAAEAVVATHGFHQVGVEDAAGDAVGRDRVLGLGAVAARACGVTVDDARRVDDGDLALAVLGGVNAVDDQLVVAVVGDVHAGIAIGRLDHAAAGAEDLAGQDHAAALGHHVFHHDGLLRGVEIGLHGDRLGAEAHTRQRVASGVNQLAGRPRHKTGPHVQLHVLRAALD